MAGVGPQPGYGVVNQQHGRLRYAARIGNLYRGGNQAIVTTAMTAGLPTTYTGGLVLYNPLTSTVRLSILEAGLAFVVAQPSAASVVGLGVAHSASALAGTLTAVASVNALVGSSNTPVGLLYSSASITLPAAPKLARILTTVDTGALTTEVGSGLPTYDIGGGIELEAGSYCVFVVTAADAGSSFMGSLTWEEIPATG